MKFKLLIIFFFLFSCTPYYTKSDNIKPYSSTGFAYIYNLNDYDTKLINKKFNNDLLQISHKDLRNGTLIKLINPKTKENLVLKNINKTNYPDFYKILITKAVANKLKLNSELPLIEILEIKKNKSFIAEKAKIYQEEKKISANAPITSVKISNISKKKPNNNKIIKPNIYILIASFYNNESAYLLKKRIVEDEPNYDNKKLIIQKKTSKEFEVLSGPYKSINLLKNDYIVLKNFGFEELDIFINE
jgi:uncharacterized membrane-anchored protein